MPAAVDKFNAELIEDMARLYADPLGFVRYAFPWQESGPLKGEPGPDENQIEFLKALGAEIKSRKFDALNPNPVMPILMAETSGHGTGKEQPKSLILDTPTGQREWGSLQAGDSVFGVDGSLTTVLMCHEQGVKPIYRVRFDDGSSTLVGLEHLWTVKGRNQRRRGLGWITISTQEILRRGVKRPNGISQAKQWEIPVQGPARFPARQTSLHPYLMGLWISDGTHDKPEYSKPHQEVTERVRSIGYTVADRSDGTQKYVQGISAVLAEPIFSLGSPERYIPDEYKFNSVANRLELLRGLLDGDGEVMNSGSIGYSSTSITLAEDVIWLVRSLGGKAMLQPTTKHGWYPGEDGQRIECRDCFRLTINLPFNPFTIDHRRRAYKPSEARYQKRWIESIEYSHDEEAMCITVDREDGLYLTNDFIVTHNTVLGAWIAAFILSTRPHSIGTITAGTYQQLESRTWAACKKWMKMCITAHWFDVRSNGIYAKESPADWKVVIQTCKEENAQAFAGQHAANSTSWYIFDEASEVPDEVWKVAMGGLTDGEPMLFAWGQPTRNTGQFYQVTNGSQAARWNHRRVDSRKSRFTNKELIEQWAVDYGEDSDFFRVRVLGYPPLASELQFIDLNRVRAAQQRTVQPLEDEPLVAGFDVSGGGAAWNVIRFRRGQDARSIPPVRITGEKGRDRSVLIGIASEIMRERAPGRRVAAMFVDSAFGAPIVERLHTLGFDNVHEVSFGGQSPDRHQANMRACMYNRMKDWLLGGAIPDDEDLAMQLTRPGYHINRSNQLVLESKQDMAKRGEASPDDSDALALSFAQPVAPLSQSRIEAARERMYEPDEYSWMS